MTNQAGTERPRGARRAVLRRAHVMLPWAVAVSVGAMLAASGWTALRPARPVEVMPVVFDRTSVAEAGAQPERAAPARSVQAPGWLEAEPFVVACSALADGVVEEMLVLEGGSVEAGEVVARLVADDAELTLARANAEVEIARAQLESAQAELAAAETDWEHPVERDRALATSRAQLLETEAELAQLPSLIDAETARLEQLREEHERVRRASASGAATPIEMVVAERQLEAQAAAVEALRMREPILEAQAERLRAEVSAAEQNADLRVIERRALDASRAGVARARGELALAEARRDEAELRLERMVIRAPIDGFVQRRLKAPGDKVMLAMDDPHSAHLVHLYDPERLQVRVDVPLADAAHVRVGQVCEVVVDVLPDETFRGEVARITHEADLQKNTLQVKVRVIDPSPILKPEMLTRVKFLGGGGGSAADADQATEQGAAVLAPERAVRTENGRSFVWAVRDRRGDRGTAVAVEVTPLGAEGGWVRVRGDLYAGDLLAVNGDALTQGAAVRVLMPEGGGA